MLQAYMDDSGSHSDSRVCVVGGYFGGLIVGESSSDAGIQFLNVTESENSMPKSFGGEHLKEQERENIKIGAVQKLDEFLNVLLNVIQMTQIYPFAVGVLVDEWEKFSVHDRKLMCGANIGNLHNAPHKPIFFVFRWGVPRVGTHCKPGIKVHFVFDDDRQTRAWASYCYGEFKKQIPDVSCFR